MKVTIMPSVPPCHILLTDTPKSCAHKKQIIIKCIHLYQNILESNVLQMKSYKNKDGQKKVREKKIEKNGKSLMNEERSKKNVIQHGEHTKKWRKNSFSIFPWCCLHPKYLSYLYLCEW